MGKPRWWVCEGCKSLNDLPANKCYKCHTAKPADPVLMDDQYDQVGGGGQARVGVSVDLSRVKELTAPDPVETQEGGDVFEAYGVPTAAAAPTTPTPAADAPTPTGGTARTPPPMREPARRSIAEVGGRAWTFEPAVPPSDASGPPDGGEAPPPTEEPGTSPDDDRPA